jgi:hypothetical protein
MACDVVTAFLPVIHSHDRFKRSHKIQTNSTTRQQQHVGSHALNNQDLKFNIQIPTPPIVTPGFHASCSRVTVRICYSPQGMLGHHISCFTISAIRCVSTPEQHQSYNRPENLVTCWLGQAVSWVLVALNLAEIKDLACNGFSDTMVRQCIVPLGKK